MRSYKRNESTGTHEENIKLARIRFQAHVCMCVGVGGAPPAHGTNENGPREAPAISYAD